MRVTYKKGICSKCGEVNIIYNKSKKLCPRCNTLRLVLLAKEREKKKIDSGRAIDYKLIDKFYKKFWDSQVNKVCFETGEKLYKFHKWHVHHLIPKKKRVDLAYNFDNCVLLTLEMHSLFHSLSRKDLKEKMPKTYERLTQIEKMYEQ